MADQPEKITAAIESGDALVCYAKCWPCQFGECVDPPAWHSWADEEDIAHAVATGQPDPMASRCGCPCAIAPTEEAACPHDSRSGDAGGRWRCDQCGADCGPDAYLTEEAGR